MTFLEFLFLLPNLIGTVLLVKAGLEVAFEKDKKTAASVMLKLLFAIALFLMVDYELGGQEKIETPGHVAVVQGIDGNHVIVEESRWKDGGDLCESEKKKALQEGFFIESCDPLRVWTVQEAKNRGML